MKEHFNDAFQIDESGIFLIDETDLISRKHLLSNLNDNVFQSIDKNRFAMRVYKNENRVKTGKDPLEVVEKVEIAEELLEKSIKEQQKILKHSIDKILQLHRNTSIFLFMLTGPFFLFFMVFKYSMKGILLTYLWRCRKNAEKQRLADE